MKMLKEKYKTPEGAYKRAAFERGINPGEVARGDVAWRKKFTVVIDDAGLYRVAWERVTA